MHLFQSVRKWEVIHTLLAVTLISGAIFWPARSSADGALAVGVPADVAKQGFAYGFITNKASANEARTVALKNCRDPNPASSAPARALCTLVSSFHDQCIAVAEDPAAGTPGIGWAISPTLETAEKQALDNCRATAGATRQDFCKVEDNARCDGSAK
jgi:Domain of unknown function (DUF4189)